MTKHETRVLYLLHKHGGRAQHSTLSQGMSRVDARDRERALASLEEFGLISSAAAPSKGRGTGGVHYWLTEPGVDWVLAAIKSGEMLDHAKEPRARVAQEREERRR